MFPSSLFKKADSKDSSLSQDEEELTSSIFASIVTPNAKKKQKRKSKTNKYLSKPIEEI
jgi:hypothetical protein